MTFGFRNGLVVSNLEKKTIVYGDFFVTERHLVTF